jgi:glycyl-radical enzyme activating protein
MPASGKIFEIQRFCVHDGPGIRTTVFLKGCPLHCIWCHNPEGISAKEQISFLEGSCMNCGKCVQTCSHNVHNILEENHTINRSVCEVCGQCIVVCPSKALEMVGKDVSIQDVYDEVILDKPFYDTSGGGITLSGGEPLQQIDFIDILLKKFKKEGLHSAIQTCGYAPWKNYARILPNVDLFLFDIKETDSALHLKYTGVNNSLILENLRKLHETGANIIIRLPIIPDFNDREDHLKSAAEIAVSLPNVIGLEIIPYHRLGLSKFNRFGLEAPSQKLLETQAPKNEDIQAWIEILTKNGAKVLKN